MAGLGSGGGEGTDGQERGATSSPTGAVLVGPSVWAACTCLSSCRRARKLERIEGDDFIRTTPLIARLGMAERATRKKEKGQSSTISTVGQPAVGNNRNFEPELVIQRGEATSCHLGTGTWTTSPQLNNEANTSEQGGGKDIEDPGTDWRGSRTRMHVKNPRRATPIGATTRRGARQPETTTSTRCERTPMAKSPSPTGPRCPGHNLHRDFGSPWNLGAGKRGGGMAQQQQRWTLAGRDRRRDRTGGAEPGRTASASKGEVGSCRRLKASCFRRPPYAIGIICRVLSVTAVWRWS
ncbi:hypothetical protein CPLU01_10023 [Colletotrichum plurivorum]|uniref:Uncharacterized protein n=1 Tax=Colletotrichum plurivorum TaxID=2175906 RepID=A0A8H6NAW4_9PEZI|nr:hypothetical protein CPLU01_10023 [Colletotrichum plurivorum]